MSAVEDGSVELSVGPSNGLREGVLVLRKSTIKMIPFVHGLKLIFSFLYRSRGRGVFRGLKVSTEPVRIEAVD